MSEIPGKEFDRQVEAPALKPPHKPRRNPVRALLGIIMIILAIMIITMVLFEVDTRNKSDWLYRQSAYIDTLYEKETRLLEDMQTFVNMLPPQRAEWSEQDKASFDAMNAKKMDLYDEIDQCLMEYNVNLTLWSKPIFNTLLPRLDIPTTPAA